MLVLKVVKEAPRVSRADVRIPADKWEDFKNEFLTHMFVGEPTLTLHKGADLMEWESATIECDRAEDFGYALSVLPSGTVCLID